jgi:hypothetical protein
MWCTCSTVLRRRLRRAADLPTNCRGAKRSQNSARQSCFSVATSMSPAPSSDPQRAESARPPGDRFRVWRTFRLHESFGDDAIARHRRLVGRRARDGDRRRRPAARSLPRLGRRRRRPLLCHASDRPSAVRSTIAKRGTRSCPSSEPDESFALGPARPRLVLRRRLDHAACRRRTSAMRLRQSPAPARSA